MSFVLFVYILAALFSFFILGILLGAVFYEPVREKIIATFRLLRVAPKLHRSSANPILEPGLHPWTAEAVINPAALILDGRTHLVYRAIGHDGVSRLGYASSQDGVTFDDRLPYPAYAATNPGGVSEHRRRYSPVMYPSGGSWGGCEDPRMVAIDGKVYVTFNMFDNWNLRIGAIFMDEADFLAKRFWRWKGPFILSGGKQNKNNLPWSSKNRDKNWMLFPEKIGGRFVVLHTVIDEDPDRVGIVYVDSLEDLPEQEFDTVDPQKFHDQKIAWHIRVRSAGPPPIKTDRGWLVLYHAHDTEGSRYKLGAMLLDLLDPARVLHRAQAPVLVPDADYENDGKPGVIYACGATEKDGMLHVYYGGADKVVCVASAPLGIFLDELISGASPELAEKEAQEA